MGDIGKERQIVLICGKSWQVGRFRFLAAAVVFVFVSPSIQWISVKVD